MRKFDDVRDNRLLAIFVCVFLSVVGYLIFILFPSNLFVQFIAFISVCYALTFLIYKNTKKQITLFKFLPRIKAILYLLMSLYLLVINLNDSLFEVYGLVSNVRFSAEHVFIIIISFLEALSNLFTDKK